MFTVAVPRGFTVAVLRGWELAESAEAVQRGDFTTKDAVQAIRHAGLGGNAKRWPSDGTGPRDR